MVVLASIPGLLEARDEVDGSDGEAVNGDVCGNDGPSDGHGEVVIESRGCEGTGGLDEEDTGIAIEGDGVGVP